jgi:hypothetical protein
MSKRSTPIFDAFSKYFAGDADLSDTIAALEAANCAPWLIDELIMFDENGPGEGA